MAQKVHDATFAGGGPFAIHLLQKFVSLDFGGHLAWAIAQFEFEDGSTVHVPIDSQVVAALHGALGVWKVKLAAKEAEKETKH